MCKQAGSRVFFAKGPRVEKEKSVIKTWRYIAAKLWIAKKAAQERREGNRVEITVGFGEDEVNLAENPTEINLLPVKICVALLELLKLG